MSAEAAPELKSAEMSEEQKFKSKFPNKKPIQTDFLRKRLQKGVKYFDSGDYNMAKSEKKGNLLPQGKGNVMNVGSVHPTPDKIPQRKTSVPSKLLPREQELVAVSKQIMEL